MKKVLIITGAIVFVALVAAGSFWGGIAYHTSQVNQIQARFESARGPAMGGQMPEGFQPPGGLLQNGAAGMAGRGGAIGGTNGLIKTIDGNVMTISTAQDVTTVNLSDATRIELTISGVVSDLQPGMRVQVSGEKDGDGSISASQVRVLGSSGENMTYPSPTGTAP